MGKGKTRLEEKVSKDMLRKQIFPEICERN